MAADDEKRKKDGDSSGGPESGHAAKGGDRHEKDFASAQPPDQGQRGRTTQFPVIGIGASAGGLDAFKQFFSKIPPDTGMAFVLVQHLDPNHESLMADLIGRYTKMTVQQAENAMPLEPDHVYMIPPGKFIRVANGGLFLDAPVQQRGLRMPIDHFFRSLAEAREEHAIAVVLSGTGSDGSQGVRAIKEHGGLTIVQEPGTAEYEGMPRSAISTGLVDLVLPIHEMPKAIADYVRHPYVRERSRGSKFEDTAPEQYQQVLTLLRAHTDYDFRSYKTGTLDRRIQRRMSLHQHRSLEEYVAHLRRDRSEIRALFKDLLITVTRFFRDPETWVALQEKAAREIVAGKQNDESIRIWVPGCATGEEAYSLAVLFAEEMTRQHKEIDIQIFATDIDDDAIAFAREGEYPQSVIDDLTPSRARNFFTDHNGQLQVVKRLRQMTVFAIQNLIGDPPFSNVDLISCRNLLIYLDSNVQGRIIKLFHFALRPGGFLFLGTSETLGKNSNMFRPIAPNERLYKAVSLTKRTGQPTFPIQSANRQSADRRTLTGPVYAEVSVSDMAQKLLLEEYAPASVLVTRRQEVVYVYGAVRDFLRVPQGQPTAELMSMADDLIRPKLRATLNKVIHGGEPTTADVPGFKINGSTYDIEIDVRRLNLSGDREDLYLVSFRKAEPQLTDRQKRSSGDTQQSESETQTIAQLEYELLATREDLQSTIEELESSNEELKASNEEVMSMNEELQSTNEELETSREELQSLNEELTTVNNQLEDKVDELENTTDDLSNLLGSTDIATIFLDTRFCIRRFTPATSQLLNILPSDIGRPISDLAPKVIDPGLLDDARIVLERLTPQEAELRNGGDRWYLRRIVPYRTADNRIDGVVITFTDITPIKMTSMLLARRERQQAGIAELGRRALSAEHGLQSLFDKAVKLVRDRLEVNFVKLLRLEPQHNRMLLCAGVGWKRGLVGKEYIPAGVNSQGGYTIQSESPVVVENLATEKRFNVPELLKNHGAVSGLSVVVGPPDRPWGVLGAHTRNFCKFTVDDINFIQSVANTLWEAIERERVDGDIRDTSRRLELALQAGKMGSWEWDIKADVTRWSEGHFTLLGYEPFSVEPGWEPWQAKVHPEDYESIEREVQRVLADGGEYVADYRVCPTADSVKWIEARGYVTLDDDGHPDRMHGVLIDIDEHKEYERRQAILMRELDHRVKNMLASIAAIASQTRKGVQGIDQYVAALKGRIDAIARAHSLLSRTRWHGANLKEILDVELSSYRAKDRSNVSLSGPAVWLRPEDAEMFAMAIHELATNAAKYGVFKSGSGHLNVVWSFEAEPDIGDVLMIDWTESGGPPVNASDGTGYGTIALTRLLPYQIKGTVDLTFPRGGARCRITIPADRIVRGTVTSDEVGDKEFDTNAAVDV